ncbi:GNAT family N-acetyltransferase [Stenotrophomonas sp. GD03958]|uniref:GNAT family N-acetyltransferase n=1 Tax=Stenotrophomonas sp. GD03958 TaxID=2975411 RepID=UPI002448BF1E|nr:GNAT family N-acetyltransferase [Stenotrophomonas sp. GD03958]MDH1195231.1 GNAT family N-acetyltransferase [Stenotrophomonas sp. GD03958]
MPSPRFLDSLQSIAATDWDALHDGRNPFVSHAFLSGLEQHGCLREDWGWQARHFTLWEGNTLVGAIPGYLKTNSHGEFVFDHAWANAYARHGRDYYPKWLGAVPYSPVTGPRLLARHDSGRAALLLALREALPALEVSSAHINFHTAVDEALFGDDWLLREDVQFQWQNQGDWATFEQFLGAMNHKHRKNIRQERAKVTRQGISFRVVHGDEAGRADLQAMYRFYLQTFLEYGNAPALTEAFLRHLAISLGRGLVLFLAEQDGEPIAGALCLRGGDTLYGRYWGGATLPGLHFEACYYQGIEYCLREGLSRFEPGAQGEHKLARGFLPTLVRSRHWVADPEFAEALQDWCRQERRDVRRYQQELQGHGPFRVEP